MCVFCVDSKLMIALKLIFLFRFENLIFIAKKKNETADNNLRSMALRR